ncbi:hypothetical protein RHS04_04423 [Rhizoctonia solani]|uniref:F-box domain-containing protein n=1 Tax=Rhizoctonia solani TaxID=456999 RepID=A0A8H7H984_9AGAM|nr:hypothetical protein RHS04_04423 [Rhizoctonia solani]
MNIASPPSAHFPLEIFSVIISFTSDPGTLCSLARCCRAFTRSAEFYLYDTLKFAPGLKAIQLARALVRSSRRSSYVRDASVELIENAIQPILLPAGIKLIIRAIVGCPNLGSLSLSWGSWRVNWPARLLWPNTFQLHRFVSWFQWDQTICDFLKTQSSLNVLVTVRPVQLRGVAPEPEPHLANYALPFLSSFTGRLAQAVSVLPGRPVTSLALNGSVSLSEFESALPVLAQTSAQIESLALQTGELSSKLFTLLGAHIPTLTRLELRIVRPAMVAYSNLTSESVCQAMSLLPGMRHFGLRLRCPQLFGALWFHTQRDVVLDWKEHCPNLCEVTFESSSDDKVMEWAFDEEAMDWGCSLDEDN